MQVDNEKIKIDWEHSSWKWVDPQQVLNGSMDHECVPKLGESLRRVYLGPGGMFTGDPPSVSRTSAVGQVFLETIDDLKTDTKNGARVLATKAVEGLQKMLQDFRNDTPSRAPDKWHDLKIAAYQFIHSARLSMSSAIEAAILDYLHAVTQKLSGGEFVSETASQIFEECIGKRRQTVTKIAKEFTSFVKSLDNSSKDGFNLSIFTLSSSSTIVAALSHLLQSSVIAKMSLVVFESRPQCEGADLAASIASLYEEIRTTTTTPVPSLNIKIVPDTHASLLLGQVASTETVLILLGADRITPLSNTSNKTGSANLAILAKTLTKQAQVVILSEEDKIARADSKLIEEYEKILHDSVDRSNHDLLQQLSEKELKAESHEQHDIHEVSNAWSGQARMNLLPLYRNSRRATEAVKGGEEGGVRIYVDNIYFEFIPREYVDIFISENGPLSRTDVLRKSIERARLEADIFADLFN